MSIRNFKVVKVFEFEGKQLKLGEEIITSDKEGSKLVERGLVVEGRFLDPADPADKKKIDQAEKKFKANYEQVSKKNSDRVAQRQDDLAAEDEEKENLLEEAKGIIPPDVAEVEVERLSKLSLDDLRTEVESIKSAALGKTEGDEEKEPETPEVGTKKTTKKVVKKTK